MPRLDPRHWLVSVGDDWGKVAQATGFTKQQLAAANGATVNGGAVSPSLKVGQVIHLPF